MKKLLFLIPVIVVAGLLVPFETSFVPEWRLKVVDETGKPYVGKLVRQFCNNYSLGVDPCGDAGDSMQYTDEGGYVSFPERGITANLLSRIIWPGFKFLLQYVHGGFGTQIYVDSSGPHGLKRLEYIPSQPIPEVLILPSKPDMTDLQR